MHEADRSSRRWLVVLGRVVSSCLSYCRSMTGVTDVGGETRTRIGEESDWDVKEDKTQ